MGRKKSKILNLLDHLKATVGPLAKCITIFFRPQACESLASVQARESVEKKSLSKRCGLVGD